MGRVIGRERVRWGANKQNTTYILFQFNPRIRSRSSQWSFDAGEGGGAVQGDAGRKGAQGREAGEGAKGGDEIGRDELN
jgi:hypothetical protein